MRQPCEHLQPVLRDLIAQGYRPEEVPSWGTTVLLLRFPATVDVEEIKKRIPLPDCVMTWKLRSPHWEPNQGVQCTEHRHVLSWVFPDETDGEP